MAIAKPNFFVVGAPKSGTTSLYIYLSQHPQVFLPRKKELNYFCFDLHFNYPLLSYQQFMSYYEEVKNETAIGEISVWNLFSKDAAQKIFDFNPESKIIIMLRNPVEMMYVLHSNHLYSGNENINDFGEALNEEEIRKRGELIPNNIRCPYEGLQYREVAKYSKQVLQYFKIFGRENVKVILFDDFIGETERSFKEILLFLKVDENFLPELKPYNVSKTTRSKFLKQLITNPPSFIKRIGKIFFPHQTKRRDWLMIKLWKLNSKKLERRKMDERLREKLILEFTPEINELQKVIEKDLSHWLL
ncbi:MAG: sulfotransferase [Chitinophagales bacterium]|nr:sulfotransferase [Chitinophagales bacterium]